MGEEGELHADSWPKRPLLRRETRRLSQSRCRPPAWRDATDPKMNILGAALILLYLYLCTCVLPTLLVGSQVQKESVLSAVNNIGYQP